MKLLPDDQAAVEEALREVREAASACVPNGYLNDTRLALGAARSAILRANILINDAEDRARAPARKTMEIVQ
jgi:hypothetical protein